MKGYLEFGVVVVLSDMGQSLSDELSFHLLTTYDDLCPRLQVENAAICLHPLKHKYQLFTQANGKCIKSQNSSMVFFSRTHTNTDDLLKWISLKTSGSATLIMQKEKYMISLQFSNYRTSPDMF